MPRTTNPPIDLKTAALIISSRHLLVSCLMLLLAACDKAPEKLEYQVVATHSHDPESFTQGLEFHKSRMLESSGQYGKSNIRETDPTTGKVLRKRPMAEKIFAEGITVLNGELWVLTWKENIVHVLEPDTFRFIRSHHFQGEGWGLAHDGSQLIMSDGTSTLKFIDPKDFSVRRTLEVTRNGRPLERLNELEMVNGEIFANVYMTHEIVRISPESGKVTGWLDLSPLRRQLPSPNRAEALNGIAHDPATGHLWVTGKYWPSIFELRMTD